MKRVWIGAVFLLVLLLLGLGATWAMEAIHRPIGEDLDRAAACAAGQDWENADHFYRQATERWEKWEHFRGCLADHTPIEEVAAGFRAAEVYRAAREDTDFAARCRELAKKVAAVGEAHGLGWWNVL